MMGLFRKAMPFTTSPLSLFGSALLNALNIRNGSTAGKTVTVDTALSLSTVFSCTRLISQTMGTLPFGIFSVESDDTKKPAKDHPLWPILRIEPNLDMSPMQFVEVMTASFILQGNAYAQIVRNGINNVVAFNFLEPQRIMPRIMPNGDTVFIYNDYTGRNYTFESEEILHIPGFGLNGRFGLSVIGAARNVFGAALAADESSSRIFQNAMRPSGVITIPTLIKKEQRTLADAMLERFKGTMNIGGTPILEGGMKYEPYSIPPNDAQLLETRQFNVEEICRWFNVNPGMIGHITRMGSGSGLEEQTADFVGRCLQPIMTRWEQAIRRCAMSPADKNKYEAMFDVSALMRTDSAGKAALYAALVQNAITTRNEIRARENLPRDNGVNSDKLTLQSNLTLLEKLGQTSPTPPVNDQKPIIDTSNMPKDTTGADASNAEVIRQ